MSSINSLSNTLTTFDVPPLPCSLDAGIFGLESDLAIAINILTSQYAPGNLIANISSLGNVILSNVARNIADRLRNLFPGVLPQSFIEDMYKVIAGCSIGNSAQCNTLISSVIAKYTSLGTSEHAINVLLSLLTGENVDICNALPNIKLFSDGTQRTYGLPGRMSDSISDVARLPSDLYDSGYSSSDHIINNTLQKRF